MSCGNEHHGPRPYPLQCTWIALGLLPGKIILVRNAFPLPPERSEERYRLSEAPRRYSLRVMGAFGWGFVVYLAAYPFIELIDRGRSMDQAGGNKKCQAGHPVGRPQKLSLRKGELWQYLLIER